MTLFQESAPAPKVVPAGRANVAPFVAIAAGPRGPSDGAGSDVIRVLRRPADVTIQGTTDTAAIDGYLAGLTASNNQARIASAQELNDGWEAALVTRRASAVEMAGKRP